MYATNEWDQLKSVIVGSALEARLPDLDLSVRTVNYADKTDQQLSDIYDGPRRLEKLKSRVHSQQQKTARPHSAMAGNVLAADGYRYPESVIVEAQEDLHELTMFLKSLGIQVHRPDYYRTQKVEYYDYCPRDIAFVHGKTAIATPMPLRCRHDNYRNIEQHIPGLNIIQRYSSDDLYNLQCLGDPDTLALTDVAPAFDAANVLRANDHVLYLVSNSGNRAGARLLQEILGDTAKVHLLEGVYSYMHIDSTVAFLREGLMLLNPARIKDVSVLPEPFRSWDYIMCPEPVDIGHHPGLCNASPWINMNLFSVSPDLVVLEENQQPLRAELEKYGIQSEMLPMRHQRTLGGGFHCVTLDLERKSGNT